MLKFSLEMHTSIKGNNKGTLLDIFSMAANNSSLLQMHMLNWPDEINIYLSKNFMKSVFQILNKYV